MNPIPVSEMMIPVDRYPHLLGTATLMDALDLIKHGLEQTHLSGFRQALVLNPDGTLIGTISKFTLLEGMQPALLVTDPGKVSQGYSATKESEASLALEIFWNAILCGEKDFCSRAPVSQFAQPVDVTLAPTDTLGRALSLLLKTRKPMIVVMQENIVVGVVRLVDIYYRVADLVCHEEGMPPNEQ